MLINLFDWCAPPVGWRRKVLWLSVLVMVVQWELLSLFAMLDTAKALALIDVNLSYFDWENKHYYVGYGVFLTFACLAAGCLGWMMQLYWTARWAWDKGDKTAHAWRLEEQAYTRPLPRHPDDMAQRNRKIQYAFCAVIAVGLTVSAFFVMDLSGKCMSHCESSDDSMVAGITGLFGVVMFYMAWAFGSILHRDFAWAFKGGLWQGSQKGYAVRKELSDDE